MAPSRGRPMEHQRAAAYFDQSGELFDSLYSLEKTNAFMRSINKLFRRDIYQRYLMTIKHLQDLSASSVLDVGIGGARYAAGYLESGVTRVVGVDISTTMIQFAREHVSQFSGHDNIFEFVLTDIDGFETDEKFDVVVAMGLFDYLPDTVAGLKRLLDFCDHSAIVSFPSISVWRTPIRKLRYWLKNCPVYFFRRHQITRLALEAGFASSVVHKIRGSGMDYVAILKK